MSTFWIVIITAVVLFLVLTTGGIIWSFVSMGKEGGILPPTTEANSIAAIKVFLNIDFDIDYTLIDHNSHNSHPDRPQKMAILLSDQSFDLIQNLIDELDLEDIVEYEKEGNYKDLEEFEKNEKYFTKEYNVSDAETSYPLFSTTLNIDYDTKILTYLETGF